MSSVSLSAPVNLPDSGELVLPAPAKLNLFLHICGRRADGYHNLQTVFQFLDYSDELRFRCRDDGLIQLHTPIPGVPDSDNLVVKAAGVLQHETDTRLGADIWVNKCLPMGGGIGGGSSNAATTLVALNALWQCHLSRQQLQRIGLRLGADVPVFIYGHCAWAEGVGEQLQALDLAEPWYVVVVPPCHVSTAEIFSARELTRDTQAITIAAFLEQGGRNDCEALVKKRYPAVKNALDWLNQFAEARMTGTGACVFAQFASRTEAQKVLNRIPDSLQGFIARGANQSPLYHALARLTTK